MPLSADQIRRNAEGIRRRIDSAAQGRAITFCAACKTQGPQLVAACRDFDFDVFGENRSNELTANWQAGAYGGKPVDFIGHLQSRKAREVVGRARLIHSVDSPRLMEVINREALGLGIIQDCLVEINIGGEASKSGISPAEVGDLLGRAGQFPGLRVRGIMSIPPICSTEGEIKIYFTRLFKLFIDTRAEKYDNVTMDLLSMGMSSDFELAIKCGANFVRIGTALFGPRDYPPRQV